MLRDVKIFFHPARETKIFQARRILYFVKDATLPVKTVSFLFKKKKKMQQNLASRQQNSASTFQPGSLRPRAALHRGDCTKGARMAREGPAAPDPAPVSEELLLPGDFFPELLPRSLAGGPESGSREQHVPAPAAARPPHAPPGPVRWPRGSPAGRARTRGRRARGAGGGGEPGAARGPAQCARGGGNRAPPPQLCAASRPGLAPRPGRPPPAPRPRGRRPSPLQNWSSEDVSYRLL